jgi:hypothetical protein
MEPKLEGRISKMEQARAHLNAALEKAHPQDEIYPSWKLKQVLDHITGWDDFVVSALQAYLQGEPPVRMVDKGLDQFNARSVFTRKELTLEQSRQAYDAARERLLEILRGMLPDQFDQEFPAPWGGLCTPKSIIKIFVSHEHEHARHIEDALEQSAAGS